MKFLFDNDVPDSTRYVLEELEHDVTLLLNVLETTTPDSDVLDHARENEAILITCNRDDFLSLAEGRPHPGIIILIRRKNRVLERAALLRLIESAGESGLIGNINFA